MSEEETLPIESEIDSSSAETEESIETSSESESETVAETSIPYEDTIQYDVNYNFGYISIWFGVVCGFLAVLTFFRGFGRD